MLALENKTPVEENKPAKKITFKDEPKKKGTKDPFDMEGLQKVLKKISNEVVDLKKQVAENSSSKIYFISFKRTKQSPPPSQSPTQTLATYEDGEEEEKEEVQSTE